MRVLDAYSLLRKNPHLTRDEIIRVMEDNLCCCGGYDRIVFAIERAPLQASHDVSRPG